jgi:hypothetical protein
MQLTLTLCQDPLNVNAWPTFLTKPLLHKIRFYLDLLGILGKVKLLVMHSFRPLPAMSCSVLFWWVWLGLVGFHSDGRRCRTFQGRGLITVSGNVPPR